MNRHFSSKVTFASIKHLPYQIMQSQFIEFHFSFFLSFCIFEIFQVFWKIAFESMSLFKKSSNTIKFAIIYSWALEGYYHKNEVIVSNEIISFETLRVEKIELSSRLNLYFGLIYAFYLILYLHKWFLDNFLINIANRPLFF